MFPSLLLPCLICPSPSDAGLVIHYIDVGDGDATLIQAGGKTLLIDAGSEESGKKVLDYLTQAGVCSLDVVVASHPDLDHIGGLSDVIRQFRPGVYYDNGEKKDRREYDSLMAYLETSAIPRIVGRAGMQIPFTRDVTVQITSPDTPGDDMDENSLCLLITHGQNRFFFPGDCETCDADADVVKLAHHGSKGAADRALLSGSRPAYVIISVGNDKKGDNPAPSTIRSLREAGVGILLTSWDGTILLFSDGERFRIESERRGTEQSHKKGKKGK